MWKSRKPAVRSAVVLHIDRDGLAKGVWRKGDVQVLVVDERDPDNRIYRIEAEANPEELRRRLGGHPLSVLLEDEFDPAAKSEVKEG